MLEFSDAAYQFFPAEPSPFLIRLGRQINRLFVVPGNNHRIPELEIRGYSELVREEQDRGTRLLFVANHATHSDPQVLTEVHRRMDVDSCFMAAYDVFLRSKFQAWSMQKMGAFSIDREGSDRKAMTAAINVLKDGDHALNIFPEGNVYLTNDRVTPFLDGTAFIALKAQKSLGDSAPVKIVPVSMKFTHIRDPREYLYDNMKELAASSGYQLRDSDSPIESVIGLGTQILSEHLRKHGHENEFSEGANLHDTLETISISLIKKLESELDLTPKTDESLVDPCPKSALHHSSNPHRRIKIR